MKKDNKGDNKGAIKETIKEMMSSSYVPSATENWI